MRQLLSSSIACLQHERALACPTGRQCLLTHSLLPVSGRERSWCCESQTEKTDGEKEECLYLTNQASDTLTRQAFLSAGEGLTKHSAGNGSAQGGFCCQAASQEMGNNSWFVLSFLFHSVGEIQPVVVTQCPDCVNPESLLNCKKGFFGKVLHPLALSHSI